MQLSPTKLGIRVECTKCGRAKTPVGRSDPHAAFLCNVECSGYWESPFPGPLFPGESEEEFGFPVGFNGTKEVKDEQESD